MTISARYWRQALLHCVCVVQTGALHVQQTLPAAHPVVVQSCGGGGGGAVQAPAVQE